MRAAEASVLALVETSDLRSSLIRKHHDLNSRPELLLLSCASSSRPEYDQAIPDRVLISLISSLHMIELKGRLHVAHSSRHRCTQKP